MNLDDLVLARTVTVFVNGRPVFCKEGDALPRGVAEAEVRRLIGADALERVDRWRRMKPVRRAIRVRRGPGQVT